MGVVWCVYVVGVVCVRVDVLVCLVSLSCVCVRVFVGGLMVWVVFWWGGGGGLVVGVVWGGLGFVFWGDGCVGLGVLWLRFFRFSSVSFVLGC